MVPEKGGRDTAILLWLDARTGEESMMSPRPEAEHDIRFRTPPLPLPEWPA